MELSAEELDFAPSPSEIENPEEEIAALQAEIGELYSRLNYHPLIRNAFLGGLAGYVTGGPVAAIGGAVLGALIGKEVEVTDVDKQVIANLIQEKEAALKRLLEAKGIEQTEISGIMNSRDLIDYKYAAYEFDGKWKDFFGDPGKHFHAMVYGRPKQGKSIFSVQFARYLSKKGKVLYIASEEGFSATLQKKIREFGMSNKNLDFANFRDYESISRALQAGKYEFIFIDSVNFIKITPEQVEQLKTDNPYSSFVTVQQATKNGDFRGSQEFAHNCDMIVQIEAGVASQQGRYQEPSEMNVFDSPEGAAEPGETPKKRGRGRPRKNPLPEPAEEVEEEEIVNAMGAMEVQDYPSSDFNY